MSSLKCRFYLTTGIEAADFVFYISAMETERCQKGMTVAYAAHCQQESALDRLVAWIHKEHIIMVKICLRNILRFGK